MAALPLSSGAGPRAPILRPGQGQLTLSGVVHDNQQPAIRRSRQVLMKSEQLTWVMADKNKHYGGGRCTGFENKSKVCY